MAIKRKRRRSEFPKQGSTTYQTKIFYSKTEEGFFKGINKSVSFKEPLSKYRGGYKYKQKIEDDLTKKIFPLLDEEDERRSKKHGRGRTRTFRIHLKYRFKHKTIKSAISIQRTHAKDLTEYKKRLKKKFLEKMNKYLLRKDLITLEITGYSSEVLKNASRSKATKKRQRKAPKIRRVRH